VACVRTSVGAIWAKLWWDDREDSRVKYRRDGLQKRQSELGRAITGNFQTTNLGVVMAESLLNNRSRRHVLRLMSLPRGDTLPGCDTAMEQRMVHFSECSGRIPTRGRANGTRRQHLGRGRGVG